MKYLVLLLALSLAGCSGITNDFASTNQMILDSNAGRLAAYGNAMAACEGNAACQVGVSAAYFGRSGEHELVKPERTAEVLAAIVPFASLGLQAVDMFYGGSGASGTGSAGYVVTGDNNTFSGIGNSLEASGESSISAPFSSSNSFSWSTNNRDYTLGADTSSGGTVTDTGVVDTAEPVVTGDTVTTTDTITP